MTNLLLFPLFPDEQEDTEEAAVAPIADAEERELALDISASWIVEAPAGSGKTGLLMQRYLKLLANETVGHPEEVLAITFTRKATAELRTRVLEQLEDAARSEPLSGAASGFDKDTRAFAERVLARDKQLNWGLLSNPGQLRIRTIDAVCAEIARALPLLSGSGGSGAPVEDARPLYRLAARRTLMHLGGADAVLHNALQTVLLHRDGDLGNCESLLASMLAQREQWAELVPLDRASLTDEILDTVVRPRLEANLQGIVCAGLSSALKAISPSVLHELTTLAYRMASDLGHPAESAIAICANKPASPGAKADHLEHWLALAHLLLTKQGTPRKVFPVNHLTFILPKPEQAKLKEISNAHLPKEALQAIDALRALPPPRYPEDQWNVAKALFRLLLHSLAELKVLFAERGECDFTEFSLAAHEALNAEGGVADLTSIAGRSLRHLLVDEMQDTSSAQYGLLELLTQSWDGHTQTVFLVGDPKQSIYMFRQARVERFLRTIRQQRLGEVPTRAIRLTANFRSQADLVHTFNEDFARIFPTPSAIDSQSEAGDVPFVEASPVRASGEHAGVVWHAAVLADANSSTKRTPRQLHALEEALTVRHLVEAWKQRPFPPGRTAPWRIAILARARNHLAPILAEFQSTANRPAIPFRAVDVEQLGERQEVLDALALTRALLHPADRTAWLAVLRAPWCGLSAADLLALTGDGASVSASKTRGVAILPQLETGHERLSAEGQKLVTRVLPTLIAAQQRAGRVGLPELVKRTWLSLGGDVTLSVEERANVQRFLDLLGKSVEAGARVNLATLENSLKNLYAAPSTALDAVDMMTIHKAKGLEWDFVIVPATERQGQVLRYELLNWLELDATDAQASVLLAPIHEVGDKPGKLSTWIRNTKESREEAERKRLLYVACTRAREELHLFGACERKQSGDLSAPRGTLLRSFWPAAAQHFAALAPPAAPTSIDAQTNTASEEGEVFAIAASAEAPANVPARGTPVLHRLPLSFDPAQRFRDAADVRLPYRSVPPREATSLFDRPEGSLAIRAFGNTVHRFLELLAMRMQEGRTATDLLSELPGWQPRLLASLRSEGLPPSVCARESVRALATLQSTLNDPVGRWVLSPLLDAGSETALTLSMDGRNSTMRVDRTFTAGVEPLSGGTDALWIVDFKTTEQGSRSERRFEQEERAKYGPQLETYAKLLRAARSHQEKVLLGLYYPAVPRLIYWPA